MVVEYQYGRQEMAAFGNMRHDQKDFIFDWALRIWMSTGKRKHGMMFRQYFS